MYIFIVNFKKIFKTRTSIGAFIIIFATKGPLCRQINKQKGKFGFHRMYPDYFNRLEIPLRAGARDLIEINMVNN